MRKYILYFTELRRIRGLPAGGRQGFGDKWTGKILI